VFDESDQLVQFKLDFLRRAMPAEDAIVYGDIYGVDGAYTAKCIEYGCKRALLIDTHETAPFVNLRLGIPEIDFYKGDFSDPFFMASVRETYEIGVVFDILLHQPPLISTIHLMLEKVDRCVVVVQPMLEEQGTPNTLVYLPGNTDPGLHPYPNRPDEYRVFEAEQVNQSHWIWAMTPSFLRSALAGEGFEVTYEHTTGPLTPNPSWSWRGFLAERRFGRIPAHWSAHNRTVDLRGVSSSL
jgi:hypothetical protein